jgi:hypothetical protein
VDRQSQTNRMTEPEQPGLFDAAPRRIPLEFSLSDIRKLKSESHALRFSMRVSGYDPKEIPLLFNIDPGQWSNILNGKKHFPHDRRNEFMDFIGNEVLLMYGCESRGYDFSTLRKHKSELEVRLEEAEKRARDAEYKLQVAVELLKRAGK